VDYGLRDRSAIVTGGTSGIGAAAAIALAREGCDVAIVDCRPAADAAPVVCAIESAGRRALVLTADVRDAEASARALRDLGSWCPGPDILVYSAGITDDAVSWKMTPSQWDDVVAVNLTGCFHWNRSVGAVLRKRGWGRIVNIASINGLRGKFGQANYAASKGGVIALTKTLARELGRYGVTVNAVAPGIVRTSMVRSMSAKAVEAAVAETLVGRMAEPEDCAAAITFLCSEPARHVTGQVLRVDGGQYL